MTSKIIAYKLAKLGEFRVFTLRETLEGPATTPEEVVAYWQASIATDKYHHGETESLYCVCVNVRRRVIGHHLVAHGTLDTILAHPREVFRPALVANAAAIILMHNHPSGDPSPSEADIKITRDLTRAGELLKVQVLDHIIMGKPGVMAPGHPGFISLRELGYFYT